MPDKGPIQQLLNKATACYHSGEYQEALQIWQEVLDTDPTNQRAKEGIRMASLLLEEAQAQAQGQASEAGPGSAASESPESIAKVREGIARVRSFLASAKYLEAIEVCRTLLQLAPRSAAVHEILEEAREAYEAQPFINEHLEIARQLFIQERLPEAEAECQKIFFLNPNHAEAKKLVAKIQALQQKKAPAQPEQPPAAAPTAPGREQERGPLDGPDPADTLRVPRRALGEAADAPEGRPAPPETGKESTVEPGSEKVATAEPEEALLNENWEAELAQLTLAPSSAPEASSVPPEAPAPDALPLMDLSEDPVSAMRRAPAATPASAEGQGLDARLGSIVDQPHGQALPGGVEEAEGFLEERAEPPLGSPPVRRASHPPAQERAGSALRWVLPLLGILAGGGVAYWYFGLQVSAPSGSGNRPATPRRAPSVRHEGGAGRTGPRGDQTNLGLSSTGSRPGGQADAAGVAGVGSGAAAGDAATPARSLSPAETHREIERQMARGRSLMRARNYQEAVEAFAIVLDLDPASLEAKDQMDQAAAKVQEHRRLEEDLQTAKRAFVEKDYESALMKFYRIPKDRHLGEVDLFIRNAWYNWGVMSLKGGNCMDALERLNEALTVDPDDQEALKQQEVAERYRDKPKDRVFYAYVDRLTFRTLNQK